MVDILKLDFFCHNPNQMQPSNNVNEKMFIFDKIYCHNPNLKLSYEEQSVYDKNFYKKNTQI